MDKNYLTIAVYFFGHFIKIALFGRNDGKVFFKIAKFESFEINEVRPFVGAPAAFLHRMWSYLENSWSCRLGDLTMVFLTVVKNGVILQKF